MGGLSGRSVIVTGGGSGIGQATAVLLAEAGCRVTVADLNRRGGDETVAQIEAAGGKAHFVGTDVSDEAAVAAMVRAAVASYGRLDGAVNCAAVPQRGARFHELTAEDFDRTTAVNLRGVFFCMKHEITAMLATGGGAIVNVASMAALFGVPRAGDYCASKGGVMGMTRSAAADYPTSGIRINAVLPGGTLTPMLQVAMDQDPNLGGLVASVHPMNRIAQPREMATVIKWLISDDASFITGLGVPVDGGQGTILIAPGDR